MKACTDYVDFLRLLKLANERAAHAKRKAAVKQQAILLRLL